MPITYKELNINWETFYKYMISPFSNRYKDYVRQQHKIKANTTTTQNIITNILQISKPQNEKNILLKKKEENEFSDLLLRISESDKITQNKLLFASPLNSSKLKQLIFFSKYKDQINTFLESKRKHRKKIMLNLPSSIRIMMNNNSNIENIQNNYKRIVNSNIRKSKSLNNVKFKLFDSLDENDFAMSQMEKIGIRTKYPLLFRGKSCCCEVLIYIYIYIFMYRAVEERTTEKFNER